MGAIFQVGIIRVKITLFLLYTLNVKFFYYYNDFIWIPFAFYATLYLSPNNFRKISNSLICHMSQGHISADGLLMYKNTYSNFLCSNLQLWFR